MIDETHDPARRCWVPGADGHAEFPIQNLPLGVFSPAGDNPRGGVAIGDQIFDLRAALAEGLFPGESGDAAELAAGPTLAPLMAAGAPARRLLRRRLSELLSTGSPAAARDSLLLHRASRCELHLPSRIGNFSDFFAGINHATNAGLLNRPGAPPLQPNYKWVPVGYHSRASSVRLSGHPVARPAGQMPPAEPGKPPDFGPCRELDIELELGVWVGPGSELARPVPIAEAADHIFGYCLLNDWSARDIQRWEALPLGPFLGKSFMTSISPWIVTPEALAPFRQPQAPRPEGDPRPLPYLWDDADQQGGALDLAIEVSMRSRAMAARGEPPTVIARCNTLDLYWTMAQLLAHHTVNGCNLESGDLLGSGTMTGPAPQGQFASLLELSKRGREPFELAPGETRTWLEDGDEVVFRGTCSRRGFVSIGFGECRGTVVP